MILAQAGFDLYAIGKWIIVACVIIGVVLVVVWQTGVWDKIPPALRQILIIVGCGIAALILLNFFMHFV